MKALPRCSPHCALGLLERECSKSGEISIPPDLRKNLSANSDSHSSRTNPDFSDVSSSHGDDPDYNDEYGGYTKVLSKRQHKKFRGKGPKHL